MDPSNLPRLMAILQETAPATAPAAADQPDALADGICSTCHQACTWQGLTTDELGSRLLCIACRAEIDARPKRLRVLPILAHPFTWVGAAMLLAVALYLGGAGNIRPGHYAKWDADKPWYQQRDALMWLKQARRIQHRLIVMDAVGGPETERRKWAQLQSTAFAELIDHWQDEDELMLDLVIGISIAKTEAGMVADAYEWLNKIAHHYDGANPQDERYLTYLTHRGIASLATSEKHGETLRKQGIRDLEFVLHALADEDLSRAGERTIDEALESFAIPAGKDKAAVRRQVTDLCQSELSRGQLLDRCVKTLDTYQVDSAIADELRRDFDMKIDINPTDATPDAGLIIDRVSD